MQHYICLLCAHEKIWFPNYKQINIVNTLEGHNLSELLDI